ncbi:serine hydrolase domain-containing protein [Pseudaestuariivita rosea]|uniref:serine hydrolase domain-containing protein n=1 Tax=Pseudaestuariivita rosea TaxID=2763263 RepID=UPI001ABB0F0B|nr:serine hydrolase [Pseudaestuariivita rosea]
MIRLHTLLFLLLVGSTAQAEPRALDQTLQDAFAANELPGLHSALIAVGDKTLAEVYFTGEDERWGQPIGPRDHGPDTLHDLRSVTKSIVGLLYGIALAEGKVPPVDHGLIAQFPEYTDLNADPQRRAILIEHALTMQMGIEWNEDLPYTNPLNSEVAMELSDDRYRYALDRSITGAPGEAWVYNGGAVALIAKLIADGTGQPIDAYAQQELFAPLGITRFEWVRGADGEPSAASGLRLTARDLARIGQMINQDGMWNGQQIVPKDWFEASFTPHVTTSHGLRYGYFWWLSDQGDPPIWMAGFGNGGQRLTVQPDVDFLTVVFAGNYNDPMAWQLPVKIISDFAVPAARRELGSE